ncbi:uncharacterized protein LOC125224352 [Salvia hispanica]|uniref:uncharacterized protein LOC125224352 n=1 Tax=Salvia hispanica TaxID=49212 RepID=UPI002009BD08|nr:uncharacterized protein LOC125224352 [Salvia hispanica]
MEGVSATVYKGIKGYWRRKGYERLDAKAKPRVVELGGGGAAPRRRPWRIKLTPPRLKLKLRFSPKKLLLGLRDAYMGMMMKIASTRMIGSGFSGDGVSGFGMQRSKEYDRKMIVEIYKSIVVAQGQLVPRDAAWICSEITCTR